MVISTNYLGTQRQARQKGSNPVYTLNLGTLNITLFNTKWETTVNLQFNVPRFYRPDLTDKNFFLYLQLSLVQVSCVNVTDS